MRGMSFRGLSIYPSTSVIALVSGWPSSHIGCNDCDVSHGTWLLGAHQGASWDGGCWRRQSSRIWPEDCSHLRTLIAYGAMWELHLWLPWVSQGCSDSATRRWNCDLLGQDREGVLGCSDLAGAVPGQVARTLWASCLASTHPEPPVGLCGWATYKEFKILLKRLLSFKEKVGFVL